MKYVNMKNGYGLKYIPADTKSDSTPWFDDYDKYLTQLAQGNNLLLSGEPGAGKTHIAEDVREGASRELGKACLQIAMHINGSNPKGQETTLQLIEELKAERGILVVDNADYIVYTGGNNKSRRSMPRVLGYIDFIQEIVSDLLRSETRIFATCHTQEWRDNHSRLESPESVFNDTYPDSFFSRIPFSGSMNLENVIRILQRRGLEQPEAERLGKIMEDLGSLSFRNAFHIDLNSVQNADPENMTLAIEAVQEVKNIKIAGGL